MNDTTQGGVTAALAIAEAYCGRKLAQATLTEVYDGDGTDELLLDAHPVASVTSVTITDDAGAAAVILGAEFRVRGKLGIIKFKPNSTADYRTFPEGFQNISVVYVAGYATLPGDVQEALPIIESWLRSQVGVDLSLQSERLGDYQYTRAVAAEIPAAARALLARYRDIRIGG